MGRDDPLVPVAIGYILSRLILHARLEIIDDGHLFLVTRAESVAPRIERFSEPETADMGGGKGAAQLSTRARMEALLLRREKSAQTNTCESCYVASATSSGAAADRRREADRGQPQEPRCVDEFARSRRRAARKPSCASNARCSRPGLTEATTLIRGYQPLGDPKEIFTKQTDFAKELFSELALQGARISAQTTRELTAEAVRRSFKTAWRRLSTTFGPASARAANRRRDAAKAGGPPVTLQQREDTSIEGRSGG